MMVVLPPRTTWVKYWDTLSWRTVTSSVSWPSDGDGHGHVGEGVVEAVVLGHLERPGPGGGDAVGEADHAGQGGGVGRLLDAAGLDLPRAEVDDEAGDAEQARRGTAT